MKNLKLIVLAASELFLCLIFATMAGAGAVYKITKNASLNFTVYDFLSDGKGLTVVAFIFVILAILLVGFAIAVDLLKIKFQFANFVLLGAALLALVAGIFFFLTSTQIDGYSLGVGAVFSGLFAIFGAAGSCVVGLKVIK